MWLYNICIIWCRCQFHVVHGGKERRQKQNTALQNEGDAKRTKKNAGKKLEEKKEQRKNCNMLNGKRKKKKQESTGNKKRKERETPKKL